MTKLKVIASGLMLSMGFYACNPAAETGSSESADSTDTVAAVPVVLENEEVQIAYDKYLQLKDNLVSSDAESSAKSAAELASALAKIDGCENAAGLASKIAGTDDLAIQRINFTILSDDVIAMMKHTPVNSGSMFVQYCPMANDGEGGYWLASEKQIRNPYYGDAMLHCGEVKETLSAK